MDRVCTKCGAQLNFEGSFCINCGAKIDSFDDGISQAHFCSKCGMKVDNGQSFCINCGFQVNDGQKNVNNSSVNNVYQTEQSQNYNSFQMKNTNVENYSAGFVNQKEKNFSDILDVLCFISVAICFFATTLEAVYVRIVLFGEGKSYYFSIVDLDVGKAILAVLTVHLILTVLIKIKKIPVGVSKLKLIFPSVIFGCLIYFWSYYNDMISYLSYKNYISVEFRLGFYLTVICCILLFVESLLRFKKNSNISKNSNANKVTISNSDIYIDSNLDNLPPL